MVDTVNTEPSQIFHLNPCHCDWGPLGEGMDPLSARLDSSSDAQSMERNAGSLAECDKKRGRKSATGH